MNYKTASRNPASKEVDLKVHYAIDDSQRNIIIKNKNLYCIGLVKTKIWIRRKEVGDESLPAQNALSHV